MINIGLIEEARCEVARILNTLLADEHLLSTKTRKYRWNVNGGRFYDLHALFGEQYAKLDVLTDELAERVRSVGGFAIGTMTEFLKFARLDERPRLHPTERAMVEDLLDDHEALIRILRDLLESGSNHRCDVGTAGLLTRLLQEHEKMAWMLRSHVDLKTELKNWVTEHDAVHRQTEAEKAVPDAFATDWCVPSQADAREETKRK